MIYVWIIVLLHVMGCAHRPAGPTELQIVEPELFSICEPKRGENQDETRIMHGKGFNSVEYGCL